MNGKILNKLLNMTINPVRAAALLLAVTAALCAFPFATSTSAVAVEAEAHMPSPDSAGWQSNFSLAQSAPLYTAGKSKKQLAGSEDETAQLRDLLKEKTQWFRDLPVLKTIKEVMPQLWTPIRLTALLLVLIMYVTFHFRRQARNRLEAEQMSVPTDVEREFRVTANTDGKGASS